MNIYWKMGAIIGVVLILLIILIFEVGVTISDVSKQNTVLKQQNQELQVENETLQYNLDIATPQNDTNISPELEALNTIGEAIGNSKKTEITIETKDGTTVHFLYEAK